MVSGFVLSTIIPINYNFNEIVLLNFTYIHWQILFVSYLNLFDFLWTIVYYVVETVTILFFCLKMQQLSIYAFMKAIYFYINSMLCNKFVLVKIIAWNDIESSLELLLICHMLKYWETCWCKFWICIIFKQGVYICCYLVHYKSSDRRDITLHTCSLHLKEKVVDSLRGAKWGMTTG